MVDVGASCITLPFSVVESCSVDQSPSSSAGVGFFRDPPVYLKPGDVVTVSVDRIGELTNPVEAGW
jgi:2-keto-4-pentenoate hydratase/2-oxohepta-3-ene-1,7-dioic acid hydratase in catechol pathway